MSRKLADYLGTRDNNFNIIRFVAAVMVLFSHSFELTGRGEFEPLRRLGVLSFGALAVDIFFLTSGLLIARSFYMRNDLKFFIRSRILRIYPGLIVAVLFTVLVIGVYFTTHPVGDYLTDPETRKYVVKNSILIFNVKFFLPGVFENLPYPKTVNGSLWTLPYEIKCYAILTVFAVMLGKYQKKSGRDILKPAYLGLALLFLGIVLYNHFSGHVGSKGLQLFATFFIGAAAYLWRDKIVLSTPVFWVAVLALVVSVTNKVVFYPVYMLTLPYIILYLAFVPGGFVRKFNKFGDYSYGIYIYAFPIQQSVVSLFPNLSFAGYLAVCFAITLLLAMLSWHLVEKKCLKYKKRSNA